MRPILCLALLVYTYILFARVILSFVFLFRPGWSPSSQVRPLLDFIYALTDPPVNYLRRFIPPIQSGGMALDLAFLVWFLIIYAVRVAICRGG